MSRKLPDTSISAYRALTPEKLNTDYRKIIAALQTIGTGTYEQIALFLGWGDINKCARRLKEMEGMELIWKPGAKKLTKRNRQAYVYQLTGNFAKTENELPEELKTPSKSHVSAPTGDDNGLRNTAGFKQGSISFLD